MKILKKVWVTPNCLPQMFSSDHFLHLRARAHTSQPRWLRWCSVTELRLTLRIPMDCSTPGFPALHHLLEFAQTHVHGVRDAIHPSLPLSSLPSIFPRIRAIFNESPLRIRWPKYWSFSISLSNEYSGLISFKIDWLDLLAGQGTLKSFLQHNWKASILLCSVFLKVQLSHPYMTTGRTTGLIVWNWCYLLLIFLLLTSLMATNCISYCNLHFPM